MKKKRLNDFFQFYQKTTSRKSIKYKEFRWKVEDKMGKQKGL